MYHTGVTQIFESGMFPSECEGGYKQIQLLSFSWHCWEGGWWEKLCLRIAS